MPSLVTSKARRTSKPRKRSSRSGSSLGCQKPVVVRSRRAHGVVLLFVVVLLTLLAVIGSAYLISSRLSAGQVGPEARAGEADTFGTLASSRVDDYTLITGDAAMTALFLDLFESERILTTANNPAGTPPVFASAARDWPVNTLTGAAPASGAINLLWHPAPGVADPAFATDPAVAGAAPVYAAPFTYATSLPENDDWLPTTAGLSLAGNAAREMRFPFLNIDALGGTDPWLASSVPDVNTGAAASLLDVSDDVVVWPWISAPLIGLPNLEIDNVFFNPDTSGASPFGIFVNFDAEGDAARANWSPTQISMAYSAPGPEQTAGGNPEFYNDRNRSYPALYRDLNGDGQPSADEPVFMAADVDGDGVADAGLVPIVQQSNIDPTAANALQRYYDPTTDAYYFVAVRVVDNNALVNVNTALSHTGDAPHPAGGVNLSTVDYESLFSLPNYGIWTSNIGLLETFPIAAAGTGFGDERLQQFQRIMPSKFGNPTATVYPINARETGTITEMPTSQTFGETMSLSFIERLQNANPLTTDGPIGAVGGPTIPPAPFLDDATTASLHFKGGGWKQQGESSRLDNLGYDAFVLAAGNFMPNDLFKFDNFTITDPTRNLAAEQEATGLWAAMFKTMDPDRRFYGFSLSGSNYPISPRAELTNVGGVNDTIQPHVLSTAAALNVDDGTLRVPTGMPDYSVIAPVKANLNSARFHELFRAYWNVMTAESNQAAPAGLDVSVAPFFKAPRLSETATNITVDPIFDPSTLDLPAAATVLPTALTDDGRAEQMLLLRAALAAVQTMDIRDQERRVVGGSLIPGLPTVGDVNPGDADITVAEVELRRAGTDPQPNAVRARVYGSEAQPFIAEVIVDYDNAGALEYIGIELVNPYPFPIVMKGWGIADIDTTGVALPGVLSPLDDNGAAINDGDATAETAFIPAADPTAGTLGRYVLELGVDSVPGGGASMPDATTVVQSVPGFTMPASLSSLTLMRPAVNGGGAAGYTFAGSAAFLHELIPLDMVDFTGSLAGPDLRFYYSRNDTDPRSWQVAMHGEYIAGGGVPVTPPVTTIDPAEGVPASAASVDVVLLTPPGAAIPPSYLGTLGRANTEQTVVTPAGTTFPEGFPLGPVLSGPVFADNSVTNPVWPYGGFARDGDALGIPMVGGYVIYRDAANDGLDQPDIATMVPVTVDLEFAMNGVLNSTGASLTVTSTATNPGRLVYLPGAVADSYQFLDDLLEYVVALPSSGLDYFPNADQRYIDASGGIGDPTLDATDNVFATPGLLAAGDVSVQPQVYLQAPMTTSLFEQAPGAINSDGDLDPADPTGATELVNELDEAYHARIGRMNPFTNSQGMMKLLPITVDGATGLLAGTNGANAVAARNLQMRTVGTLNTREPFETLATTPITSSLDWTLRMSETLSGTMQIAAAQQPASGDLTGRYPATATPNPTPPTDATYYDYVPSAGVTTIGYEQRTVVPTRLSNLTTGRSDSYTVYVMVQAWRNVDPAGGLQMRLIRQQRTAFVVDRSQVYAPSLNLSLTPDYSTQAAALEQLDVTPIPTR